MKEKYRTPFAIFIVCFLVLIGIIIIVANNSDDNEDVVNEVNKNGSIETAVSVEHLNDSFDIIITKHNVWNNNIVSKETIHRDTIASLGNTLTAAENEDGDEKTVEVKKDYEIYITVK